MTKVVRGFIGDIIGNIVGGFNITPFAYIIFLYHNFFNKFFIINFNYIKIIINIKREMIEN